jgi:hypothetical protein
MTKKSLIILIILPIMILLPGCSHKMRRFNGRLNPKAFMNISIGMTKDTIIERISKPDIIRGSMINNSNQTVEVWEYRVEAEAFLFYFPEPYWLYFYDNKLVQWGKAGDWDKAADNIQEVRFR